MAIFLPSEDPNINPIGGGPEGNGLRTMDQGLVTFRAIYNRTVADKQHRASLAGKTIYQVGSEDQLNIEENEFCFIMKHMPQIPGNVSHGASVLSSFNGAGMDAAFSFPEDEEMQLQSIMAEIEYLGVSLDGIKFKSYTGNRTTEHIGLKVAGTSSHLAGVPMAPGSAVQLVPPSPSSLRDTGRPTRPGTSPGKARLEPIPYNPITVQSLVRTQMYNIINNSQKWESSMSSKSRKTDAWLNFGNTWHNHALMNFFMILDGLTTGPKPILNVSFTPGGDYDLANPRTDPNPREIILGQARAFGMLEGTTNNIPNITVSPIHKDRYKVLKRDLMARVFYDGRIAQLGFGFEKDKNPGISQKGTLLLGTTTGKMFYNQMNHWLYVISGLNDALLRDWSRVVGTVFMGSGAGGTFHMMLKK
jgi:hypothetical protein